MKSIHLAFREGSSDKEYKLRIVQRGAAYAVEAEWGKRGTALQCGDKAAGVDLETAEKTFAKVVKEKTGKGYKVLDQSDDNACPVATPRIVVAEPRAMVARILPQLCEAVNEDDIEPYLLNDQWVMEPKWDGKRREIIKSGDSVTATNRNGLESAILPELREWCLSVPFDFTADTEDEVVGGGCVLLDILALRNKPMDRLDTAARRERLCLFGDDMGLSTRRPDRSETFSPGTVHLTYRAVGTKAKRELFEYLKAHNAEGCIFKKASGIYVGGEAGRGEWVKVKFWKTATVIVERINVKRSFDMAVSDGLKRVHVGSCTILPDQTIPQPNDIVEVRYLYARVGGKLFQPKYLQNRSDEFSLEGQLRDVTMRAVQKSQLIYKQGDE